MKARLCFGRSHSFLVLEESNPGSKPVMQEILRKESSALAGRRHSQGGPVRIPREAGRLGKSRQDRRPVSFLISSCLSFWWDPRQYFAEQYRQYLKDAGEISCEIVTNISPAGGFRNRTLSSRVWRSTSSYRAMERQTVALLYAMRSFPYLLKRRSSAEGEAAKFSRNS